VFPTFQFKTKNKIIADSEGFVSNVEGSVLNIKLNEADMIPSAVDTEHVAIGGWKLNVSSLIESKANSDFVVLGWKNLEKYIPLKRLMILYIYSTVIFYARFGFAPIVPHWGNLLRICYWHQKCLEIDNSNFDYKQREIKKALLKTLRNAEKTLGNVKTFIPAMEQLDNTLTSYISELQFPSLAHDYGYTVSFCKENDFIIDNFPAEVKSVHSHFTIERKESEIPSFKIHGQVFGKEMNPLSEIFKFMKSRKFGNTCGKAYCQNGEIIFLDSTYTFASTLLYLLADNKTADFSFEKALRNALELAREGKRLPVIINASVSSLEHLLLAFVVPMQRDELTPISKLSV